MRLIDVHNHLLWGLDDGCESPGETLAAARVLAELGYADVVASPHAQARYPAGEEAAARSRLEEAQRLIDGAGVPLRLHLGAENPFDDRYLDGLGEGRARALGPSGRYALVELPFNEDVPDLGARLARLRGAGLEPVLAHPERCLALVRPGRAAEAVARGASLQLNLGALTGRHGERAQEVAERLLGEGLYAMAGTDLHGPDGAGEWIDESLAALERLGGREALRRLCVENPARVLAGDELA